MASAPPENPASARELMSLGMFVFGMDSAAYQSLTRSREWRHALTERHGARDAAQYVGPGPDTIQLGGLIVPELGAQYSSLETLAEMADEGETWPLMDGLGRVLGHYRIVRMEEEHLTILAGGIPRHKGFRIDLERGEDEPAAQDP